MHFKRIAFVFLCALNVNATGAKIHVDRSLKEQLLNILNTSDSLHTALVMQNEKLVKSNIDNLRAVVNSALALSLQSGDENIRVHLVKTLRSMKGRLNDVRSVPNADPRKKYYLRESFQQIVQIARSYDLNHKYVIFFCAKDKERGVWLQKNTKAQNPFDPAGTLAKCGSVVR